VAIDVGVSITHAAENMLLGNQTLPESDAPPLASPHPRPISTIKFTLQGSTSQIFNKSPLMAPSITIITRGMNAMETTVLQEKVMKRFLHGSF
jgi:hypothetical protein